MGKYICAMVILLALFPLGCGVKPRPLDEPVYVMEDHGLAIDLPGQGWVIEEFHEEGAVVFRSEEFPGWFMIMVTPHAGEESAAGAILSREMFVEFRDKRFNGPPSQAKIGGEDATCLDVGAKLNNRDIMIRACSVAVGGRIYDFVCWSHADDFNETQRVFSAIIADAQFQQVEVE